MKYIIIDLDKETALTGREEKTLNFTTAEVASEVASQSFASSEDYMVIPIKFTANSEPVKA